MSPNERVVAVKGKVADKNGWVKDAKMSAKNGRDVYRTQDGQFRAADTQHGRIEYTDEKGKHLGEYDIEGKQTKKSGYFKKT